MKKLFFALLASAIAINVMADDKVVVPDSTGFRFTDTKVIRHTPVKDQNK